MNNMLATDAPALPRLETWVDNDRMRHIPSLDWIVRKIDGDIRSRIEKLTPSGSPAIEAAVAKLIKALDRLSETARHGRTNGAPADNAQHIQWSLEHALASLRSVDANTFGRRHPYHLFEKSRGELIWGAALAVIFAVNALVEAVREVDPSLDERLLEGLVILQNPVDERMLKPIA